MRHQEILDLKWPDIDGATTTVQRCISNYRIEDRVKTDFMGGRFFKMVLPLMQLIRCRHVGRKGLYSRRLMGTITRSENVSDSPG
jgi:hypothetical protein